MGAENGDAMPEYERLKESISCDVLIIGAGLAGLACAYKLGRAGVDCTVVEAGRVFGGTSGRTNAKITLQHGLIYAELIKKYGKDFTRGYINAQIDALSDYGELFGGSPELFGTDTYIYSTHNRAALEAEAEAYEALGYPAELCESTELPISTVGALRVCGQYKTTPSALAKRLARGVKIYENTRVFDVCGTEATVHGGKIKAKKIIVATHFPIINRRGLYPLKLYQNRSYSIMLSGVKAPKGAYMDADGDGLSFVEHGESLVVSGGAHRTGIGSCGWEKVESFIKKRYTGAVETARWAAQDCMTLDKIMYAGEYAPNMKDVFVSCGFNKWGMTGAMAAAGIITDLILGKKNPYEEIFSPSRSIFHKQLFTNIKHSVKGLVTLRAPRCTHLGCALTYNKAERSWDCACHGSRFTPDGKVLNSPATDDL